jgi:hypothetical protein
MNIKKILWWILLLFGEVIIIGAWNIFGANLPDNIFLLNILVCSIIYFLFFIVYRMPWIDLKDIKQKQIGSIGICWTIISIYTILSLLTIYVCNYYYREEFSKQLILQCVLLFFLLLFFFLSNRAKEKVGEVYEEEKNNCNNIIKMKKSIVILQDNISNIKDTLPKDFINRIDILEEKLRYLSPTNNKEAHEKENDFIELIEGINLKLSNYSLNRDDIEKDLSKCEHIYQNRKQIYSN